MSSRAGGRPSTKRHRLPWRPTSESWSGAVRTFRPYLFSSGVRGLRHQHMRELRIQQGGRPLRVFYAFDPRRRAILLVGGDKTGDTRFYERYVQIADEIYDRHLA